MVQFQTGQSGQVAEKIHGPHLGIVVGVHPHVLKGVQPSDLMPEVLARDLRACATQVKYGNLAKLPNTRPFLALDSSTLSVSRPACLLWQAY